MALAGLLLPLSASGESPYTYGLLPPEAFAQVVTPAPTPAPTPSSLVERTPTPASPSPAVSVAPRRSSPPAAAKKPVPRLTHSVVGVATWYCLPGVSVCTAGYPASGAYGAAGPALRAALGNWRGRTVYVNGIAVKLVDWCACGGGHVIDVFHATWVRIPNPSHVTVSW